MSERNEDRFNLDLYSLCTDVLKSLWAILLGAIAVVLIMDLLSTYGTQKSYSTKATFVVTSRGYSANVYSNLSAAQSMATTFTNILNSDILKKEVCKDVGMDSFDATVNASVINETNLLELRVTSDAPLKTFQIIRSIMNNYKELTQYVNQDAVMQVLEEPTVPMYSNTGVRNMGRLRRYFIMSFGVLVLLFLYLSYRHDTIKSELDLNTKVDAKALGVIDHESRGLLGIFKKKKRPLVNDIEVSFGFVEQYKKLVSRLVAEASKENCKTILVTSVSEHEGKSSVAANIALTLVRQNYKTILIDCDLRRPIQAKQLGIEEELTTDYVDYLKGEGDLSEAGLQVMDLPVLLAKKKYPNSTELITTENMSNMLDILKQNYDYIIVDTPPMSILGDAEALADICDMSVLVIQYNRALAEDINDAVDALNMSKSKLAGTVLNDLKVMPGTGKTAVAGGYGRYGRYGRYGKYGNYGKYGKYGKYGHYAERKASASKKSEVTS